MVIASRVPVRASERIRLTSQMGRSLLIARLACDPPLTVATVHLESTADETATRVRQLEQIRAALPEGEDIVLVGDMNFPAGERPEAALLRDWTDAWPALRPDEPGYTVDSVANTMRYLQTGKHQQKRIDRVFHRGRRWRVAGIELLGTRPLADDPTTFASDHFGLLAELVASEG